MFSRTAAISIGGSGLSDTIKRTIPAKFCLIWLDCFREDLNVIFHKKIFLICIICINQLKEKIHIKNSNIFLTAHCHVDAVKFELILIYNKAAMQNCNFFFFFRKTAAILNVGQGCRTQF